LPLKKSAFRAVVTAFRTVDALGYLMLRVQSESTTCTYFQKVQLTPDSKSTISPAHKHTRLPPLLHLSKHRVSRKNTELSGAKQEYTQVCVSKESARRELLDPGAYRYQDHHVAPLLSAPSTREGKLAPNLRGTRAERRIG